MAPSGVIPANANALSWRVAYQVFSALVLVIGLFATLVCVRSYPDEVGLRPFGARLSSGDASSVHNGERPRVCGVSASVMFRSPVFYLLILSMGIFNSLRAKPYYQQKQPLNKMR